MPRENCCMNYPWFCDACDEEFFDVERKIWRCPFDELSSVSVLETSSVPIEDESL